MSELLPGRGNSAVKPGLRRDIMSSLWQLAPRLICCGFSWSEGSVVASGKCGIFCIESVWDRSSGEVAAAPALCTLAAHHGVPFASNSEKPFSNSDQFLTWLKKWTEAEDTFRILYVWSHGVASGISTAQGDTVLLPQMADLLEDSGGNSTKCLAHFGSCSTQRTNEALFRDFRDRSGFAAVSGYRRDVGWIKPLAFDLLYLDHVISKAPKSGKLSAEFLEEMHGDLRERSWYGLGLALGFHMDTGL